MQALHTIQVPTLPGLTSEISLKGIDFQWKDPLGQNCLQIISQWIDQCRMST